MLWRVSPSIRQRADRFKVIGPRKSEAGERTVPFPPMVSAVLREWKLDSPKNDLDLAFPTSRGGIEHHKNIVRFGLVPAQVRAGVKGRYGLHSLRHFYASWCITGELTAGSNCRRNLCRNVWGIRRSR